MTVRFFALALAATVGAATLATAQQPAGFEWPEANAAAIPDARLSEFLNDGKEAARDAADRALEGRRASAFAKRQIGLRALVGRGGQPITVDDGTVMTAVHEAGESGPMVGTITYPSGATMTGAFGPDIGIYSASETSSIGQFAGWCYNARTSIPQPTTGEFRLKSGDVFVGTRTADQFTGIYRSADGRREFIGKVILNSAAPRPVQGIMRDGSGRLLAVVTHPA